MATEVEFASLNHEQWKFIVDGDRCVPVAPVWIHIFAGPNSAGVFLTLEQARSIAQALTSEADKAEQSKAITCEVAA